MTTKFLYSTFTQAFVAAVFLSGASLAADTAEEEGKERVLVGERELPHAEKVNMKEKRKELIEKLQKEEGEKKPLEVEEKKVAKEVCATTYYSTHEGAFHCPTIISFLGDTVQLEDGSVWSVCSSQRYKTLDWMTSDTVIITPNHDWFSSYDYRLINLNTGASVKVNLSLSPIYNGIYTHWVLAMNYLLREIYLEDGSVWEISSITAIDKWLPGDTVIIGINDGWFSGSNPNMLINVNLNDYAIGKTLF